MDPPPTYSFVEGRGKGAVFYFTYRHKYIDFLQGSSSSLLPVIDIQTSQKTVTFVGILEKRWTKGH